MIHIYSKFRRNPWTTVILLRGRDTEIISVATSNYVSAVQQVSEPVKRVGGRWDKRRVKIVAVCQGGHEKFFEKDLWSGKRKHYNAEVRDGGPVASRITRGATPPFSAPTG